MPEINLGAIAAEAVAKLRDAFGDALPADLRVRYELGLDMGSRMGTCQRDFKSGRHTYLVRLNPHLLLRGGQNEARETLVHEVAHAADDALVGWRRDVHGPGWQMLMKMLGYQRPRPCHGVEVSDFRGRGAKAAARCAACQRLCAVSLTAKDRLVRGLPIKRRCRRCGGALVPDLVGAPA